MVYWDHKNFRDRISRHKVRWGEDPFLLCRTVTPESVREARSSCGCPGCYDSRRRADRYMLSHPFGSFVNPPCDPNTFALELREADIKSCFSMRDAQLLLSMMQTDPDNTFSHSSSPLAWSKSALQKHVDFLIDAHPSCAVSLLGTKYNRLYTYVRQKGPRLLMRALRSHSFSPFGHTSLFSIRETLDRVVRKDGKKYRLNPWYDQKFRICFRNIPGTIEYLVLHRCFYRNFSQPIFSGPGPSEMSQPPPKRPKTNSKTTLVSYYIIIT